jgi:hypothetical protein
MRHYRLIVFVIVALIALAPVAAHAAGETGSLMSAAGNFVSGIVLQIIQLIQHLAESVFTWIAGVLDAIIKTDMSTGGPAVYFVWKMFRDMCNMFFIVVLVIISFATIFNSWLSDHSFYYKEALFMVIIAAITMNLSLAAGQMIVWTGNQASRLVLSLMEGTSISSTIIENARVGDIYKKNPLAVSTALIPQDWTLYNQLDDAGKQKVKTWYGEAKENETNYQASQALSVLYQCLKNNSATPAECMARGSRIYQNDEELVKYQVDEASRLRWAAAGTWIAGILGSVTNPAAGAVGAAQGVILYSAANAIDPMADNRSNLAKITDSLLRLFLIVVMTLSLLLVVGMMIIRIPFVWLLLSVSSLAFFSLAWPGRDKKGGLFQQWYGTLIGWSFFGPLYLFIIYIGLFFLQQQGSMLATISASSLPAFVGVVSVILGYAVTAGIFTMGAKWAYTTAFSFGAQFKQLGGWMSGKAAADWLGGKLGADEKSGFGLQTAARLTGARTAYDIGSAYGQAGLERGKQAIRPLTERIKPMDSKERLARAKQRLGVVGGTQELADITAKQVSAEKTRLDQQMLGMDRKQRTDFLRGRMNSLNKAEALAAREHLLRMGQLNATEISDTEKMLPSDAAKIAWRQKAGKAGKKERGEAHAETISDLMDTKLTVGGASIDYSAAQRADRITAAQNMVDAIPNADAKKELINALAERDPEVAAGLSLTGTGGTPMLTPNKAYASIMKNPDKMFDLPEEYMRHAGGGSTEFNNLKAFVQASYPGGAAGSAQEQAKAQFMSELLKRAGTNGAFVNALMT